MDIPEPIKDLINLEIINKKRVWRPFMEKYDCQIICELGVFTGENFNYMIEHNPKEAVAIDAWINDNIISRNDLRFSQEALNKQYQDFANRMADKPFVKIYREYTTTAVMHFPNEYFDLIYIDADHTYQGCLKDIEDWYPKVKKGKFLVGDDFRNALIPETGIKFGVIEAVKDFTNTNNLTFYDLPRYGWVMVK